MGTRRRWQWLNELLVRRVAEPGDPLWLASAIRIWRTTADANLTDPYDDPETNFPSRAGLASGAALDRGWICTLNNTLAGRMLLGPVLGQWAFMRGDISSSAAVTIALSWLALGL